jgi:hypothetical protein
MRVVSRLPKSGTYTRRWRSTKTNAQVSSPTASAVGSQIYWLRSVLTALTGVGVGAGGLWLYSNDKLPFLQRERISPPNAGSVGNGDATGNSQRDVFNRYATVFRNGQPYMSHGDFVDSLTTEQSRNIPRHRLKAYLYLADPDNDGFVSFEDFCRFHEVVG